jgi:hypothetical protein
MECWPVMTDNLHYVFDLRVQQGARQGHAHLFAGVTLKQQTVERVFDPRAHLGDNPGSIQ